MPPPTKKAPQRAAVAGGENMLTKKLGPLPAWGWIAVAVVGFLLYKRLSGSSSSTSGAPSGGVAPPTASVTLPGGYSYSGPASGAAAFQQAVSPGNPPGAVVSPGNTGTAFQSPGYGTVPVAGIPGGQGIILGPAGGAVYQVGGGAPVYFGNTETAAEGTGAEQTAGATGGYAYTPVAYAGQVGSSPVQVGPGQF